MNIKGKINFTRELIYYIIDSIMDLICPTDFWTKLTNDTYDDVDRYLLTWSLYHARTYHEVKSTYTADTQNVLLKCMIYFWGESRGPNLWALLANNVTQAILHQLHIEYAIESGPVVGIRTNRVRLTTNGPKYVFIYEDITRDICSQQVTDFIDQIDPCSISFPSEILAISNESRSYIAESLKAIAKGVLYSGQPNNTVCFLLRNNSIDVSRCDEYLIESLFCDEKSTLLPISVSDTVTLLSLQAHK